MSWEYQDQRLLPLLVKSFSRFLVKKSHKSLKIDVAIVAIAEVHVHVVLCTFIQYFGLLDHLDYCWTSFINRSYGIKALYTKKPLR